jgi:hypothetical protein
VAHAASFASFERALEASVEYITHVPLEKTLSEAVAQKLHDQDVVAIPTLTMMKGVQENFKLPHMDYSHSRNSVAALKAARVTILAGTDSNAEPGAPVC